LLPALISGPNPWPVVIESNDGRAIPLGIADLTRTVVPAVGRQNRATMLYVHLANGKDVKCRLGREAIKSLRGASAKPSPALAQ
jgi:hypothetical protein